MNESILDKPQDTLDPSVWNVADGNVTLTEEASVKIQKAVDYVQEKWNFPDLSVFIIGSITSNSYSPDSDIDIDFVSPNYVKKSEAMEVGWKIKSDFINNYMQDNLDVARVGSHPFEIFFQPNPFQCMMSVGCYDFLAKQWIVGPDLKQKGFDPIATYYSKSMKVVKSIVNDIRNIILEVYEKALVIEKSSSLEFRESEAKKFFASISKAGKIFKQMKKARTSYQREPQSKEEALKLRQEKKWHVADAAFKFLDKFGYVSILKKYCEIDDEEEMDLSASVAKVIEAVRTNFSSNNSLNDSEKQYFIEVDQSLNRETEDVVILEPFKKEKQRTAWGYVIYFNNMTGRFALYTYDDDPKNVYLANVDIWEQYQNQGLGSQMLKFAITQARVIGGENLLLKCLAHSKACKFYEHRNFRFLKSDIDSKYIWMIANIAKDYSGEQINEGPKETISAGLLAALLAVPGILPAKTIQRSISNNQKYEMITKDLNQNVRMIGDYTAFQAANIIARTLYAEVRNDGEKGMNAVASVIFNRAKGHVDDFVNVCKKHGYSKKYKKIVYQFSCWGKMTDTDWSSKDFKIKIPSSVNGNKKNEALWKAAMQIAADMLADSFKPTTNANMYYNDKTAHPDWGNQLTSVEYIGSHKFGILKNHSAFV